MINIPKESMDEDSNSSTKRATKSRDRPELDESSRSTSNNTVQSNQHDAGSKQYSFVHELRDKMGEESGPSRSGSQGRSSEKTRRQSLPNLETHLTSSSDYSQEWVVPLLSEGPVSANEQHVNVLQSFADSHRSKVKSNHQMYLLKSFADGPAIWNDIFDEHHAFADLCVHRATSYEPLLKAAIAMGARYLNIVAEYDDQEVWQLYDEAITATLETLKSDVSTTFIGAACAMLVIIAQFEMYTASTDSWRRHLKGTSEFFVHHGVNAATKDCILSRGAFISHARMDTVSALISDDRTLIDPSHWGIDLDYSLAANDHYHAQRCTRILAEIINYRVVLSTAFEEYADKAQLVNQLNALEHRADEWLENSPQTCKAVAGYESRGSSFPSIWYTSAHAATAAYQYHTAKLLICTMRRQLLPEKQKQTDFDQYLHNPFDTRRTRSTPKKSSDGLANIVQHEKLESQQYNHARNVIGVCLVNTHPGVQVHAVQFLYTASKYLTTSHERREVITLLERIQSTTGWSTLSRRQELLNDWK